MSRSANLISRFTELSEKKSKKKYKNPIKSNGPGNPYHGTKGKFTAADDATLISKYPNALSKTGLPKLFLVNGWLKDKETGKHFAKTGLTSSPAGKGICGRKARDQGLDIRCIDGKVMSGKDKLKAAANRVKDQRKKDGS